MRSKKGLSTVVTTLIIVLLVLVAIGIIWAVIRGIIESGTGQIDVRSKCIEVDVRATAATCTAGTCSSVTLKRGAGGDPIDGVKLVFYDTVAGSSSGIKDVPGNIVPLTSSIVNPGALTGVTTIPNKVAVTAYFKDDSGVEQLCGTSSEFSF